ncbi:hypothetical protein GCM10022393_15810 [Aquimarina addita]|uniref:Uncharacterized protein n=1 Tax=Aquimarina addita TaxID=870485 RepID=A0ABP7XGD5_9FLAO
MESTQNYSSKINQNELFNISKFVVIENFKHHTDEVFPNNYNNDISSIYREEMNYLSNSRIFAEKTSKGDIIGTIRALRWDFINPLPIQKMFGINPLECTNGQDINEIWHIGRFAIKKEVSDLRLLKKLMVCAIAPICEHKDNIAFAECDAKLLRILTLMGIKAKIVGASIDYLGSETIPVSMSYNGLINFYEENKHLVESEELDQDLKTSFLPNSVVFSA